MHYKLYFKMVIATDVQTDEASVEDGYSGLHFGICRISYDREIYGLFT